MLPYLSRETYSRKYEKLPNVVINTCYSITLSEKMIFFENVCPENSVLFIYVLTSYITIWSEISVIRQNYFAYIECLLGNCLHKHNPDSIYDIS